MKEKIMIGNLELKNRIFLAPMHKINDIAFRKLCKKAGAGLCYTQLTSPEYPGKLDLDDKPAMQLVCNRINGIKEFIGKYEKTVSLWDLNLGCPSHHAEYGKVGYFLSENPELVELILKEIKKYTKKPVTIKIRKMPLARTKKIIKIAEKYCDAIAIHPRTCNQGYAGEPDVEFALNIKKMTRLPLIYSGNIATKEEADKFLEDFDFIMIGRASMGNPNIFYELNNKTPEKLIDFKDYLELAEKYELDFNKIKLQAIKFIRGKKGSSKKRKKIVAAESIKEVKRILRN